MKKILALLLVVFSLVLVGCQDDKTNGEDKTQGGNEQQTPAVTVESVSLKIKTAATNIKAAIHIDNCLCFW